jgi:hypothetical protein
MRKIQKKINEYGDMLDNYSNKDFEMKNLSSYLKHMLTVEKF